jgi:hypothetical protein
MIIMGLVLVVLGLVQDVHFLTAIGVILLVVGGVLALLGTVGKGFAGRRHYW